VVVAGSVLFAGQAGHAADEPKDKVSKGSDGWYAVEFQVGTGKVKVEFPGEPKLESDAKKADERLYSVTTAKGRRFWLRVTDGHKGGILPEKADSLAPLSIINDWQKTDPRYKNARPRQGTLSGMGACEMSIDEGKDKGFTHQWVAVGHGCLVHIAIDRTTSDNDQKRFFASLKVEKGEEVKLEATKVEPPAGWKEYAFHKTGVSAWSPVELKNNFRTSGDFGDYTLVLKDGKTTVFSARLWHVKDVKEFDAIRGTIYAPVPAKAAKVTVGGVQGICTYKDGKPVGSDTKFNYSAFVGNFFVSVLCNNNDVVSPADAEKVAVLIVQQLREKTAKP
jgi:hypothetical protein